MTRTRRSHMSAILTILSFIASTLAAAAAPPQTGKPVSIGHKYRTRDGRVVITIVSSDELEISEDGVNLVAKYTQQEDRLRVVLTSLGTTQAVYYYKRPDGGLQDSQRRAYFSPAGMLVVAKDEMCSIVRAFNSHRGDFQSYYLVDSTHSSQQAPVALDDKTDGPRNADLVRKALSPLYLHTFPDPDPWGSAYQFEILNHGNKVIVSSLGPDRKPGGGDDFALEVAAAEAARFTRLPKGVSSSCN